MVISRRCFAEDGNGNGNGIYIPHFLYDIFKCGLHEQG